MGAFGRMMFDFVRTLVVVDVTSLPLQSTIRMCHGKYQRPVFYRSDEWTKWWEHAKRAVELAGKDNLSDSFHNFTLTFPRPSSSPSLVGPWVMQMTAIRYY